MVLHGRQKPKLVICSLYESLLFPVIHQLSIKNFYRIICVDLYDAKMSRIYRYYSVFGLFRHFIWYSITRTACSIRTNTEYRIVQKRLLFISCYILKKRSTFTPVFPEAVSRGATRAPTIRQGTKFHGVIANPLTYREHIQPAYRFVSIN